MHNPNLTQTSPPMDQLPPSEYLSAHSLTHGFPEALKELLPGIAALADRWRSTTRRILLVGSGGSYAAMLTAQYILDSESTIPVTVIPAAEVAWRNPAWVDEHTLVVYVSFSGETADVVQAAETLAFRKPSSLLVSGRPGSTLARRCQAALIYPGAIIYEAPIALVVALVAALSGSAATWNRRLLKFGEGLPASMKDASTQMQQLARRFVDIDHFYVLGSGPQSSLAFKVAAVIMENVRIGASFLDISEFRHGPIEALADRSIAVLGLVGVDPSRHMALGVLRFIAEHGGQVAVIDAEAFQMTDPLLAPLALNPWTQWFVAWSATFRGISDLDKRIYMGQVQLT